VLECSSEANSWGVSHASRADQLRTNCCLSLLPPPLLPPPLLPPPLPLLLLVLLLV
jgi:hypothetical protein